MKLSTRIALVFVPLLLASAGLASGLVVWRVNDTLIEVERQELEITLAQHASQGRAHLLEMERTLRMLSSTPPIRGIPRATAADGIDPLDDSTREAWESRLARIFEGSLDAHPAFDQLRLIALVDGQELVRVERDDSGTARRVVGKDLQNKASEPYFERFSSLARQRVGFSPITPNREQGRMERPYRPTLRAGMLVSHAGAPYAMLVLNADARTLLSDLAGREGRHRITLEDSAGRWDASPDDDGALTFRWAGTSPIASNRTPSERHVSVVRPLPLAEGHDLLLVGQAPYRSITRRTWTALTPMLYLTPLLALAAVLLAVWSSRFATRPVVRLTEAVRRLDPTGNDEVGLPSDLPGESGELARALHRSFEDVRERTRQLEASNAELERFAFVASHDLQEPLRTVSSFTHLLAGEHAELFDDEARVQMDFILDATQRMRDLVNDLLAYSRLRRPEPPTRCDLGEMIQEILEDLAERVDETTAIVQVEPLPTLSIHRSAIRTLFTNLLTNALKFRRAGVQPEVRIRASTEGETYVFHVEDNGIGIAPEHREKVFGVFERLHTRAEFPGTGIGLAQVRRAVELHGGTVTIEERSTPGTTFRFTLRDVDAAPPA